MSHPPVAYQQFPLVTPVVALVTSRYFPLVALIVVALVVLAAAIVAFGPVVLGMAGLVLTAAMLVMIIAVAGH
jgi:fatty acid desaturase